MNKRDFLKITAFGLAGSVMSTDFLNTPKAFLRKRGLVRQSDIDLPIEVNDVLRFAGGGGVTGASALAFLNHLEPKHVELIAQVRDPSEFKRRLVDAGAIPLPSLHLPETMICFIYKAREFTVENVSERIFLEKRVHLQMAGMGFLHSALIYYPESRKVLDPDEAIKASALQLARPPKTIFYAVKSLAKMARLSRDTSLPIHNDSIAECFSVLEDATTGAQSQIVGALTMETIFDLYSGLSPEVLRRYLEIQSVRRGLCALYRASMENYMIAQNEVSHIANRTAAAKEFISRLSGGRSFELIVKKMVKIYVSSGISMSDFRIMRERIAA